MREVALKVSPELICFSHLRWNFVYQRPQQLLSRAAEEFRVHYFEEPVFEGGGEPRLDISEVANNVEGVVPVLPADCAPDSRDALVKRLLDGYLETLSEKPTVGWYYTPMALRFSGHLRFPVCVYDCMDELSQFKGAPREIKALERRLMQRADVVFTGGMSLFEAKQRLHANVHALPSSVDASHFRPARTAKSAPADLAQLERPRIGFFGVIDERLDVDLVASVADMRPDWQLVMIGPVVKIDPAVLPRRRNIHWLGGKPYAQLPAYLSGLDIGFMPFALNAATRYISPTKTPEFLAAGLPVVSTPIVDVVRSWGADGLVEIASDPLETVEAIGRLLSRSATSEHATWLSAVDRKLALTSWDSTWTAMLGQIEMAARKLDREPRIEADRVNYV